MTELDFDELDRAVNNLMQDVDTTKRNTAYDDPEDKTIAITMDQEQPTPEPSSNVAPAARRGRFMDVMHPSGDMKTAMMPKRESVTIDAPQSISIESSPESSPVDASISIPDDVIDGLDQSSETTELPSAVVEPETTWPDPISFAEGHETTGATESADIHEQEQADLTDEPQDTPVEQFGAPEPEQSADDVAATDHDETIESEPHDTEAPMASPFLPDAKVEKRPLGTPPTFPDTAEATSDQETSDQSSESESTSSDVPRELSPEMLNIEADMSTSSEPEIPETDQTDTPTVPVATDIVRQYDEKPSTENASNGAIYDTAAYHQPLTQAPKKAHGWMIIVWILLLLIVGAMSGAAYFYFTTQ